MDSEEKARSSRQLLLIVKSAETAVEKPLVPLQKYGLGVGPATIRNEMKLI